MTDFKPLRKISPCMVDASKIICETTLTGDFDFAKFLAGLGNGYGDYYYSDKLGVAKIDVDGKVVIVSNKGTVIVRQAESIDDAANALRKLLKAAE